MRSSFALYSSIHLIAIAMLAVALTLAPLPFQSSGDVAHATPKKSCFDKHAACVGRCNDRAGLDSKNSKNNTKQEIEAAQNCDKRTCTPQLKNCWASEKKGSKSAATAGGPSISSPTRPGLLDTRPGLSSTGPAATGAPIGGGAAPTGGAAPAGGPVLR